MSNIPDLAEAVSAYMAAGLDVGGESNRSLSHLSNRDVPEVLTHRYDKVHSDVRSCAMMTKTCYMEYDPMNSRGRLPSIYERCVGRVIGNTVILKDSNLNQIQVVVERDKSGIYFTHGWTRLRDFYKITSGAWLTLTYVNPFLFHLKLINITGIPIKNPLKDPPYELMLAKDFQTGSWDAPIPFFVMPKVFSHRLEKTLTASDVASGSLTLFWGGFCQAALPNEESQLTFIDWTGNTWKECYLQFNNGPRTTCKITGQWSDICRFHHLSDGVVVKFGVTEASTNRIIYFKLSPYIGVRTTLHAPPRSQSPTAKMKFIHESQHYFMLWRYY